MRFDMIEVVLTLICDRCGARITRVEFDIIFRDAIIVVR